MYFIRNRDFKNMQYVEKTHLKKMITTIILLIRKKSQVNDRFWHAPDNFHYETKARKVMIEFKFDALYR